MPVFWATLYKVNVLTRNIKHMWPLPRWKFCWTAEYPQSLRNWSHQKYEQLKNCWTDSQQQSTSRPVGMLLLKAVETDDTCQCRIDSFRLRGTGSMCHMFLLDVEFSNSCRFRVFQCHFSTVSRFPFPRFQLPQCWHGRTEYWKFSHFYETFKSKFCDKFFVLTMSLYAFGAYFATL